ncbi:MAG: carbohydrate ABC transporter permease [Acetivibrionales bacterium]|jgi:raffinose/stachyose/melibiose transport system permease protein
MKKKKILFNIVKVVLLTIAAIFFISPFLMVVLNSFKTTKEFLENPLALPAVFDLTNFKIAFEKMRFLTGFTNTLIITSISVLFITLFSSMQAYALVRNKTKLSKIIFIIMVASMIIPFQAIMIPLVKVYGSIGFLNSKESLIYMYMGFGASLAVFIYHGFIKSIPVELEEAAMIDGCSRRRTFFSVVFPLLKPTTMTVAILDILWIWNDFLLPSLVLITPAQRTLPLSTYYFFGTYTVDYGLLMAGLMMTILPVVIIFIFMQKYIISGVMQGSIK